VSLIKIPTYLNRPGLEYLAGFSMEIFHSFQTITLIDDQSEILKFARDEDTK
jgi:hypothetical protein